MPTRRSVPTPSYLNCGPYYPKAYIQICPVEFIVSAGKLTTDVVAKYAGYSNCNLPAPAAEPGDNGRYVIAKVPINWGDGRAESTGVAHRGTSCHGTSVLNSSGEIEHVTGIHRYHKLGTYHLSVTITYRRGAGNTRSNCASVTGGSMYNISSNCVAMAPPA